MAPRKPASVPLAEKKAELAQVTAHLAQHKAGCLNCSSSRKPKPRCDERPGLAGRQAALKQEIATWFDPGEQDIPLFDISPLRQGGAA